MTDNAKTRRVEAGGSQEVLFVATNGGTKAIVVARPVVVTTSGRREYAARCPQCRSWHRHVSLGEKVAPCGALYLLEPRQGRAAA